MADKRVLYIGSSNTLEIVLQDSADDSYVNNATVEGTLKDAEGDSASEISGGQSWPLALDYVAASNGLYRGVLTAVTSALLTDGTTYWMHYTSTSGAKVDEQRIAFQAQFNNG